MLLIQAELCCPQLGVLIAGLDYFSTGHPRAFAGSSPASSAESSPELPLGTCRRCSPNRQLLEAYSISTFRSDALLSIALNHSKHRDNEKQKILYISQFLDGDAWRWWLKMLRLNIIAFYDRMRPLPRHMPRLVPGVDWPSYWSSYEFVIPELRSLDCFLDALVQAFPDAVVAVEAELDTDSTSGHQTPRPCRDQPLQTVPLLDLGMVNDKLLATRIL